MRLLLDTNRYTDLARGVPDVVARIESADAVFLSIIALGELRAGFAGGKYGRKNEADFERFLAKPSSAILLLDETTAQFYAQVLQALRRQGKPIPTNDMWIAAQALQHDLMLDTRDEHFRWVPDLKRAT